MGALGKRKKYLSSKLCARIFLVGLLKYAVFFWFLFFFMSATENAYADASEDTLLAKNVRVVCTSQEAWPYKSRHVLLIGVSEYTQGWEDLKGVESDLEQLEKLFCERGYQVSVLRNPERKEDFEKGIQSFVIAYGKEAESQLIVYYAGHAITIEEPVAKSPSSEKRGFLVPSHAKYRTSYTETAELVPMSFFVEMARKTAAKHMLFIFDACYSGSVFEAMRGPQKPESLDLRALAQQPVRLFIASGTADQRVPDISVFAQKLQDGLMRDADLNEDTFITGTELAIFLREEVVRARSGEQTPQFAILDQPGGLKGELLFRPAHLPFKTRPGELDGPVSQPPLTTLRANRAGIVKDCESCPEMISLAEHEYRWVAPETGEERVVRLSKDLLVGRYEVTVEEWRECFKLGGCSRWLETPTSSDRHPVTNATWKDAREYVNWLSSYTGKRYRLPTSEEWGFFSRAGSRHRFPWGQDLSNSRASCDGCFGKGDSVLQVVGSFDPNSYGIFDVIGNAWEWVTTCPIEQNPYKDLDLLVRKSACDYQTLRGASFQTASEVVSLDISHKMKLEKTLPTIGFRVVRD